MIQLTKTFYVKANAGIERTNITPLHRYIVVGSDEHNIKWTVIGDDGHFTNVDLHMTTFDGFVEDMNEKIIELLTELNSRLMHVIGMDLPVTLEAETKPVKKTKN